MSYDLRPVPEVKKSWIILLPKNPEVWWGRPGNDTVQGYSSYFWIGFLGNIDWHALLHVPPLFKNLLVGWLLCGGLWPITDLSKHPLICHPLHTSPSTNHGLHVLKLHSVCPHWQLGFASMKNLCINKNPISGFVVARFIGLFTVFPPLPQSVWCYWLISSTHSFYGLHIPFDWFFPCLWHCLWASLLFLLLHFDTLHTALSWHLLPPPQSLSWPFYYSLNFSRMQIILKSASSAQTPWAPDLYAHLPN